MHGEHNVKFKIDGNNLLVAKKGWRRYNKESTVRHSRLSYLDLCALATKRNDGFRKSQHFLI